MTMADVYLYPTEAGGKTQPASGIYRPIAFARKDATEAGYGCLIEIEAQPLRPGEHRNLSVSFPMCEDEAMRAFRSATKLYLWEGRFVGEITLLQSN